MSYSLLFKLLGRRATTAILPVSMVLGYIGYEIENFLSDRYTPSLKSVQERRQERLLNEDEEVYSIKDHKFVPTTIFEKNLSPSLKQPDPRPKKYAEKADEVPV